MLKMKTAFLLSCCLMFSGCFMSGYLDSASKNNLKTIDTDNISAVGQIKNENETKTVIIGNKYVYLVNNNEFNQLVSAIPNGNYRIMQSSIDIELNAGNNKAVSQNCFHIADKDKPISDKNYTHSFCYMSMEVYKKSGNISAEYTVKSNININLKAKNTEKSAVIATLRPFAAIGDVVLLPAYLLNPFMDWNRWWNR